MKHHCKRALAMLMTFTLVVGLFAGLTGTAGAAETNVVYLTEATSLELGKTYLIVSADGAYAMSSDDSAAAENRRAAVAITISDGTATSDSDLTNCLWTCESGGYLSNNGKYLGHYYTYLYADAVKTTGAGWSFTWTYDSSSGSQVIYGSSGSYKILYDDENGYFKTGTPGTIKLYQATTCVHANRSEVTHVDPTCTEDGSDSFHCYDCGNDIVIKIPATGHTGVLLNETSAYWEYRCSVCEEVYQIPKDARLAAMTLSGVVVSFDDSAGAYPWEYDSVNNRLQSTNYNVVSSTSAVTITFSSDKAFTLSFDYQVSSESDYDKYTVTFDREAVASAISGKVSGSRSYELDAGSYDLVLSYVKDDTRNSNDDRAYLYNIVAEAVCDHVYGEPVFTWTEDNSAAAAAFTCAKCGDVQTVNCSVTSETVAEGETVYTATAVFDGQSYTDTRTVSIPDAGGDETLTVEVSASPAEIDLGRERTVVMTVKTNAAVDVAAFNFDIVCPTGWTVAAVNSSVTGFSDSCYDTTTRRVLWYNAAGTNVTTDTLAAVTFTVPAGTDVGEYTVGVADIAMGGLTGEGYTDLTPGETSASAAVTVRNSAPAGYTVTLEDKAGAEITGITSGNSYSGGVTFHVSCDKVCLVAYTTDAGETYNRLTAAANANGGYDFTVDVTGAMEIAIVLKGDVNLDGKVTSTDAQQTQRLEAGAGTATSSALQRLAADANAKGGITSTDAQQIQRAEASAGVFSW